MDDLSVNSMAIDNMSGEEFEKICAEMLSRNGFDKVELTPARGDHGIDITAWKNHKKYAVQCKRYSGNVGNKAVQEVYSGKRIYAASDAIVITNSYFTKQASEDAEDLGVILWDRDKLLDQIELAGISLNHMESSVDGFSQNIFPEMMIDSCDINQESLKVVADRFDRAVLGSLYGHVIRVQGAFAKELLGQLKESVPITLLKEKALKQYINEKDIFKVLKKSFSVEFDGAGITQNAHVILLFHTFLKKQKINISFTAEYRLQDITYVFESHRIDVKAYPLILTELLLEGQKNHGFYTHIRHIVDDEMFYLLKANVSEQEIRLEERSVDCIPEIRHKICSSKILLDITENKLKKVSIEALVKKYEMTAEEAIEECSSLEMSKFIDSKGKPTIFDNSKIDLGLFKRNLKNDYDDYTNILEKLSSPQTRCGLYVMELSVLSREDFLSIDDIQRLVDVDNNLAEYIMNILVSNGFVNQNGKVLLENSTAYQNTNTEQEKKDSDELTISEISALEALEEKLEKEILESSDDRDSSLETYIDDDAKVIIQQLDKVSLSKIGQYVNLAYKKQAKSIIDVVDGAVKPIISGGIIQDTNGDEPVLICVYFCNIKNNDEQRIQFELTYALKDIYYENGVLRVDRLANLKCSRTNTNSLFSELKNRLDDLSRGIISLLKTNIC